MSVKGIDNCRRALCIRRVIWLHRQTEAAIQTRLEYFLFSALPHTPSLPSPRPCGVHSLLVYKISESCANKPQRRLHLIYLQQNVQKLKLLRKCNFALRVFHIRIRIPIRSHVSLGMLSTRSHMRGRRRKSRGGGHATHFLATANTKAAAGSRLNWKGCGKEYETRRKKQARNKEERERGKGGCKWKRNRCVCANVWLKYPARQVGGGILKCRKKKCFYCSTSKIILTFYRVSSNLAHPTAHSLHLFFFYFMSQLWN